VGVKIDHRESAERQLLTNKGLFTVILTKGFARGAALCVCAGSMLHQKRLPLRTDCETLGHPYD